MKKLIWNMRRSENLWPQGKSNELGSPLSSHMFVADHKLLYIPIAKCACTSLKNLMADLAGVPNVEALRKLDIHTCTDKYNTGVQLKDVSLESAVGVLGDDEYFTFAVIREPYERLISAYLEKFVYQRQSLANQHHTVKVLRAVQHADHVDFDRGVTFRAFVETVVLRREESEDSHWRPQIEYFKKLHKAVHVYRIDQLDELRRDLSQKIGNEINIGHKNKTQSAIGRRTLVNAVDLLPAEIEILGKLDNDSFMCDQLRALVAEGYRQDYGLLAKTTDHLVTKSEMMELLPEDEKSYAGLSLFGKGGLLLYPSQKTEAVVLADNCTDRPLGSWESPVTAICKFLDGRGKVIAKTKIELSLPEPIKPWQKGRLSIPLTVPEEILEHADMLELGLDIGRFGEVAKYNPLHVCWLKVIKG